MLTLLQLVQSFFPYPIEKKNVTLLLFSKAYLGPPKESIMELFEETVNH